MTEPPQEVPETPVIAKKSAPEELKTEELPQEDAKTETKSPRKRTPSPIKNNVADEITTEENGTSTNKSEIENNSLPSTESNNAVLKENLPKCGECPGCLRRACSECSFCKNGQRLLCIDIYCMNTDEGRKQREEAKAKYLASLSKAKSDLTNLDFTPDRNLTIQEQVDMIMSQLQLKQKNRKAEGSEPKKIPARVLTKYSKKSPTNKSEAASQVTPEPNKKERAKHQMNAVYGSSSKAGKTRRCGACADKPRFGGRGSKKKACMTRSCRMRGPPPEGKAVTVNLQEGQTYQIMGYLDGDKAVVKPVEATDSAAVTDTITST